MRSLYDILKRDIHQDNIHLTTINIASSSPSINQNQLDQSFMYTQLLKDILLRMKYDEKAKNEFIEFCLIQQYDNEQAIRVIDEFEQEYDGSSAIWWYTRESFIYSMLNKALRTQDIDIILKMGFFIRDLHQQIKQLHLRKDNQEELTVFRGQGISNAEFIKLRQNKGNLLSFNNFLSTSRDKDIPMMRATSAQDDPELTGILFQIKTNPLISTTPFAAVSSVSYFSDLEEEILFSMHTVFRIGEMKQLDHRIWEVKLTLTDANDKELKSLTDYMRKQLGEGTELNQLGHLMLNMGELSKAEEILNTIRQSTPSKDWTMDENFNSNMAHIMFKKGDGSAALSYCMKAFEICRKSYPLNHPYFASLHNNIAEASRLMENYSVALEHFQATLKIQQKYLPRQHIDMAMTYNNIGNLYLLMGHYESALLNLNEGLEIWQKHLPANHPDIATVHNNIGSVYRILGNNELALLHCKTALEIYEKSVPSNHPELAVIHNNIGMMLEEVNEYRAALLHYEEALKIRQKSLPKNHPSFGISYNNIGSAYHSMGNMSKALTFYKSALEILEKPSVSNYSILALVYNNIGEVHRLTEKFSDAFEYYRRAQEIHKACPSIDRSQTALVLNNLGLAYMSVGNNSMALPCFEEALTIWEQSLPPNHTKLVELHKSMSIACFFLGRMDDARRHVYQVEGFAFCDFELSQPRQQISEDELD